MKTCPEAASTCSNETPKSSFECYNITKSTDTVSQKVMQWHNAAFYKCNKAIKSQLKKNKKNLWPLQANYVAYSM